MMKILNGLLLMLTAFLVYIFWAPLGNVTSQLARAYFPCRQPIAYSIGTYDERFGISRADFLSAIKEAEAVWEKPLGKNLFSAEAKGNLKINLIYDYRQEATTQLQSLGLELSDGQSAYDALKKQYGLYQAELKKERTYYESLVKAYQTEQDAYNAEVDRWNKEGGAPKKVYDRLTGERARLDAKLVAIKSEEEKLNALIKDTNAFVVVLNRQAAALNVDVGKYNDINTTRGKEFDEGLYTSGPSGERIDIYQFDSRQKLVRVLAHELGHALGIEHIDDPKAIMYRLNQGSTDTPTANDLASLRAVCKIK